MLKANYFVSVRTLVFQTMLALSSNVTIVKESLECGMIFSTHIFVVSFPNFECGVDVLMFFTFNFSCLQEGYCIC